MNNLGRPVCPSFEHAGFSLCAFCLIVLRNFFNGTPVNSSFDPDYGPGAEAYLNFKKLISSDAVAAMAQIGARIKNFQNFLKLGDR